MSSILSIAVSGLNNAAARIANSASSIVNASSTGNNSSTGSNDVATNLVAIDAAKTDYAASAAVVKTTEKIDKSLIDIVT